MKRRKTCTRCFRMKPLEDFYKDPSRKSGYKAKCKPCQLEYNQEIKESGRKRPEAKPKRRYKAIPSAFLVNKKTLVKKYAANATKVQDGELEDDYTNHMLSHFGFYDVAHDLERDNNVNYIPAPSAKGYGLVESKGLR